MSASRAQRETEGIPPKIRQAVDVRDGMRCRVCGRHLGERRALHHIIYGGDDRGMGGLRQHRVNEIVTVCWLPGDGDCHSLVHSDKKLWQPILLEVVQRSGVTALMLRRWQQARKNIQNNISQRRRLSEARADDDGRMKSPDGTCKQCGKPVTGERRFCGACLSTRIRTQGGRSKRVRPPKESP